jgi:hypothetical protein
VKFITAHDLRSGEVVYRTEAKGWSPRIVEAALFDEEAVEAALAEARGEAIIVTNAYLVEADGPATPAARVALRETIRAKGPTVRLDLGKQADGQ